MPFEHKIVEYWEWMLPNIKEVYILKAETWPNIGFLLGAGLILLLLAVMFPFLWFLIAVIKHGPSEGFYLVAKSIYGAVTEDLPGFSFRRTFAVAKVAIQEARRNKVIVGFAVFVGLMLFAGLFLDVENSNRAKTYISVVLTTTNYLVMLMALFLSAFSIPNDIKHKTIYTVVTKPIRAGEIVLGRVIGFSAVGTAMLVIMGLVSYIFVVRGMSHTHELKADSFAEKTDATGKKEGQTSRDSHHRHRVIMDKTGNIENGETLESNLHFHRVETVETKGPSGETVRTYKLGPARGDLIARSPVFGKLRMLDPAGNVVTEGINVGDEWTYRTFIEGGNNRSAAIWTFSNVTPEKYPEGLPLEMNLAVFRTFKGTIERGVMGEVTLRNINPDAKVKSSPPMTFESREFTSHRFPIPRKLKIGKNPDGTDLTMDIFEDLVTDGKIEVSIRCIEHSQYFGMAPPDVYLRPSDSYFFANFAKGYLSIWLQMVLVTCFGVMFSTFLSGPVAMMATLNAIGLGFFGGLARDVLTKLVTGGGPIESGIRILQQNNTQSDLDVYRPVEIVIKFLDTTMLLMVEGLTYILPNYSHFDASQFVANGYDVYPSVVGQQLTMAVVYALSASVAGYFFLKTREIAG
jgi:ABC-type transport system involved in multi-copper enzyme maturation permease subunit